MAFYTSESPYYTSSIANGKMDLLNFRSFPFEQDDLTYQIDAVYNNRPDLLAYDLYQRSNLWWVFAVRNPDILVDPVFDFSTGIYIYLPQMDNLISSLEI